MSSQRKLIAIAAIFSLFATIFSTIVAIIGPNPFSDSLISIIPSGIVSISLIVLFFTSKKNEKDK